MLFANLVLVLFLVILVVGIISSQEGNAVYTDVTVGSVTATSFTASWKTDVETGTTQVFKPG